MKKGIRYLRISKERQSNFSIDSQDMYTKGWFERNGVELVDTFIDEGYSAQTFDRPDFTKLEDFIRQYFKTVEYLVVNNFDRFSRDAGEALMKIKSLQTKYSINVVSVVEGITFDKNDPGSFFYTGLLLLKAEDEIIRHKNRVNLGIYTAKKKFGRYLGAAPFGYKNAKDEQRKPVIVIDPDRAHIIKFIYEAYQKNTPLYIIHHDAKQMGLTLQGHSVVERVLKNPAYTSLLKVKGFKELPSEIVEASHPPIIDRATWNAVQQKIGGLKQPKFILNEDFPLRGVLKCHCGKPLTGAPSRGKSGRQYNYYKCNVTSKHNNISVIKAHTQMEDLLKQLSLPESLVPRLFEMVEKHLAVGIETDQKQLTRCKNDLKQTEVQLASVEEKYIRNKMNYETYDRWYSDLTRKQVSLKLHIEKLSEDKEGIYNLYREELDKLTDVNYIYQVSALKEKQQILNQVFDCRLYYQEHSYRTPFISPIFMHNALILKEKALCIIDGFNYEKQKFPSGAGGGTRTPMPRGVRS